ncbi:guanylate kinase, partial [bacterium]|nr:guanylate kinase [bacterium]
MGTGGLIIISGPSGVGKGTIIRHLLRNDPTLSLAISATTRKPRLGEAEGIDYYFLSPSEFDQKIRENAF